MYVLDTCIIRYWTLQRGQYPKLAARIEQTPSNQLFIASITVVEVWRGAVQLVDEARKEDGPKLIHALALVEGFRRQLDDFNLLPYDEEAHEQYLQWKQSMKITKDRHMDYRIAATAISRGFTVVTANMRHFQEIPGLSPEDWTR